MKSAKKERVSGALLESLTRALRCFHSAPRISDDRAHDARKRLKKARAALRLLRSSLGDTEYRRENSVLRDVSKAISPLRDAKAQVEILTDLRNRYPRELCSRDLVPLEDRLLRKLERTRERVPRGPPLRRATRSLEKSKRRLRRIIGKHVRTKFVRKDLRKIYAQARKSFASAENHTAPPVLHEWRKKTKYLYNAIQSLDMRNGSAPAIGKQAHRLGDWLGQEHDLVVLSQELRQGAGLLSPSIEHSLKSAINDRRARLRKKALRLGGDTYADRPRKAMRNL